MDHDIIYGSPGPADTYPIHANVTCYDLDGNLQWTYALQESPHDGVYGTSGNCVGLIQGTDIWLVGKLTFGDTGLSASRLNASDGTIILHKQQLAATGGFMPRVALTCGNVLLVANEWNHHAYDISGQTPVLLWSNSYVSESNTQWSSDGTSFYLGALKIDPLTGASTPFSPQLVFGANVLAHDGYVFGSVKRGGGVYVWDTSGTLLQSTGAMGYGTPGPVPGEAFFGQVDGGYYPRMYRVSAATGVVWYTTPAGADSGRGGWMIGDIAANSANAYMSTQRPELFACDATTGALRWTHTDLRGPKITPIPGTTDILAFGIREDEYVETIQRIDEGGNVVWQLTCDGALPEPGRRWSSDYDQVVATSTHFYIFTRKIQSLRFPYTVD